MTDHIIKIPGPDHPITIAANPSRGVVSLKGQILADTRSALTLSEAKYLESTTFRVAMAALARPNTPPIAHSMVTVPVTACPKPTSEVSTQSGRMSSRFRL
jgi:hypothetical protein